MSFRAQNGSIEHIHLRPDEKWFAAIGQGSLHIFDSETGAKIEPGKIDQKGIYDCSWSPDGKLFSVLRKDRVDFHDATTFEFIKSISIKSRIDAELKFGPDSEAIYTYYRHWLYRLSFATGERVWTVDAPRLGIRSFAVSEDGSLVAAGRSNGRVHLYDTDDVSDHIKLPKQIRASLQVRWLGFSPDHSVLAIPQGINTLKVDLVNPLSAELLRSIDTGNHYVVKVAFSPDGTRLLTAGLDTRVNLWDVDTGELLKSFSVHSFAVEGICWFNNGASFISSDQAGYIRVTDIESNQDDAILQQDEDSRAVCIKDSNGFIATGNGRKVFIRNADKEVVRSFYVAPKKSNVEELSFSPDGQLLAVADSEGVVALWDPDSGKLVRELKEHSEIVNSLAFTPDGTKLVTGGGDGKVLVWDVATGKRLWSLKGHRYDIYSVACSPDGKLIASSAWDQSLLLWDAETGQLVQKAKCKEVDSEVSLDHKFTALTFSPDSRHIVAGTQASEIYYFNCKTGLEVDRFFCNCRTIYTMTFSPDGSRLVTGSPDWTVRIWDSKTHEELRVLTGHTSNVETVCFNRDGSKLYSASRDKTVRIWDATPSQ